MHMAQLMPLPLTVSCLSKIQIGFTFLVPAHPGSPGKTAVKRVCVCVCVCVCVIAIPRVNLSCIGRSLKACFHSESTSSDDISPSPSEFRLQPNCSTAVFSQASDGDVCLQLDMSLCPQSHTKVSLHSLCNLARSYLDASVTNQWRQREFKVGGTSLVSRLSACLTEANWWRLIAD